MKVLFFITLTLFSISQSLLAQQLETESTPEPDAYKSYDANGKVIFSDKPPSTTASERIYLAPTNIQNTPSAQNQRALESNLNQKQPQHAIKPKITITSPTNGSSIGPAIKTLSISTTTNVELDEDLAVKISVNGREISGNQLPLNLKLRGKRTITAKLVNKKTGKIIATSKPISVHIIR